MSKKYTSEEDKVIIKYVEQNPTNLKKAFDLASQEINRTPGAISVRWHTNIKHQNSCFMIISKQARIANRKIASLEACEKSSRSIWNKILNLFK